MRSPQAFQMYEQARKDNNNPQELLNKLTNNYTPEQKKNFTNMLHNFGVTDDQINQLGINAK